MKCCTIDVLGRITITNPMSCTLKFFDKDTLYITEEKNQIIVTKEPLGNVIDTCKLDFRGRISIPRYIALSKRLIDYSAKSEWSIWADADYNRFTIFLSQEQADLKIRMVSQIDELNRILIPKKLRDAFGFSANTRLNYKTDDHKISLFADESGSILVSEIGLISLPAELLTDKPVGMELMPGKDSIGMIKIYDIAASVNKP